MWVLDDGPFGILAEVVPPRDVARFQAGLLAVVSTTADAATNDKSGRRPALLEQSDRENTKIIDCITVNVATENPARETLIELTGGSGDTTDLAEREAIAWLSHHGDESDVFVVYDKRATVLALAELGRCRVAHAFDLWLELENKDLISAECFERLCETTKRKDKGLKRMPARVERPRQASPRDTASSTPP